jgi:hypothetical protein
MGNVPWQLPNTDGQCQYELPWILIKLLYFLHNLYSTENKLQNAFCVMQTGANVVKLYNMFKYTVHLLVAGGLIAVGILALVSCGGGGTDSSTAGSNNTNSGNTNTGTGTGTTTISGAFKPSLGINTEAPQAERNDIVQPMPFVDIFRTARPFKEYSTCTEVSYDPNGWPSAPTANCISTYKVVRTFLLDSVVQGMVPSGQYTVLYEGGGKINYSGYAKVLNQNPAIGRDLIELTLPSKLDADTSKNRMALQIASGTVKNIRVIMPGGICEGNPFVRVENADGCPVGKYQSFESTLANRNAIVFNPEYLNFLKDFRVVRMMNLMEASPSSSACASTDTACILQERTSDQRSKMDDAVWGGSSVTPRINRYGYGAPWEVQVELANQLNANPWFNIPHSATDTYVRDFASYVQKNLKPGLKAYVEYTNEAWNTNFLSGLYVRAKGEALGLGSQYTDKVYWGGMLYYAQRAKEVFQLWEGEFGGTTRLVRILGTYQASPDTTKNMLGYSDVRQYVDAVAMGAYFYACWNRSSHVNCTVANVPKTLSEATSLDDVFTILDNPNDPYSLTSLQKHMVNQATVAKSFGKALFAYEGGQHLTVDWLDGTVDNARKYSLLDFFRAANRDPRMGERYMTLLNAWKNAGGQQFMLYTLPQSFHTFGAFGIKESLNQPRASAPKYDAAMKFQETQGKCWWDGC